jgi:hypothetical protein
MEISESLAGKKEENGKSLNEDEEDDEPREDNGELEEGKEGDASIANGPNNSFNSERLNSPFGFLEKLSKLKRPEMELSLFGKELPRLKDGLEKDPPPHRSDRSLMPQIVCRLIGGIDFIIEDMFSIFPEDELRRFSRIFLVELFSFVLLNNSEELSAKLLKFREDRIPFSKGTFSLSMASPVELVNCFRDSDNLSESILKE